MYGPVSSVLAFVFGIGENAILLCYIHYNSDKTYHLGEQELVLTNQSTVEAHKPGHLGVF